MYGSRGAGDLGQVDDSSMSGAKDLHLPTPPNSPDYTHTTTESESKMTEGGVDLSLQTSFSDSSRHQQASPILRHEVSGEVHRSSSVVNSATLEQLTPRAQHQSSFSMTGVVLDHDSSDSSDEGLSASRQSVSHSSLTNQRTSLSSSLSHATGGSKSVSFDISATPTSALQSTQAVEDVDASTPLAERRPLAQSTELSLSLEPSMSSTLLGSHPGQAANRQEGLAGVKASRGVDERVSPESNDQLPNLESGSNGHPLSSSSASRKTPPQRGGSMDKVISSLNNFSISPVSSADPSPQPSPVSTHPQWPILSGIMPTTDQSSVGNSRPDKLIAQAKFNSPTDPASPSLEAMRLSSPLKTSSSPSPVLYSSGPLHDNPHSPRNSSPSLSSSSPSILKRNGPQLGASPEFDSSRSPTLGGKAPFSILPASSPSGSLRQVSDLESDSSADAGWPDMESNSNGHSSRVNGSSTSNAVSSVLVVDGPGDSSLV